MSSKVGVFNIIKAHFKTLKEHGKNSLSFSDLLVFIIFPMVVSLTGLLLKFNLNKDLDSLLVNFGAIFTALLLSVIVLIYDQENRILEKKLSHPEEVGNVTENKLKLLKELYHNIAYAILCSLALVVLTFIHSTLDATNITYFKKVFACINFTLELSWSTSLLSPLIVFITVNIVLTIIMIVKRLYAILIANS